MINSLCDFKLFQSLQLLNVCQFWHFVVGIPIGIASSAVEIKIWTIFYRNSKAYLIQKSIFKKKEHDKIVSINKN